MQSLRVVSVEHGSRVRFKREGPRLTPHKGSVYAPQRLCSGDGTALTTRNAKALVKVPPIPKGSLVEANFAV